MPTTYTPLATQTVSGSSTTSVTFTGISGAYTDLVVVANVASSDASQTFVCRLNGDSGSNYSLTQLLGEGTGAVSQRESNQTRINISRGIGVGTTLGNMVVISNFQNYSNTTTNKTVLSRVSEATASFPGVSATVGLWRSTAAITSIEFFMANGTATFVAGSTFSLYGVASAAVVSGAKATGGDIVTTDGTYWYHTFLSSGTFTPTQALTADYLVVAGGGGPTTPLGGGGGAGGLRSTVGTTGGGGSLESPLSLSAQAYTVTVGGGGSNNSNGSNSVFSTITSTGGGKGGAYLGIVGGNGGSGGGGGGGDGVVNGGSGTANQGYAGGTGNDGAPSFTRRTAGGGGGAGAVGANAVANTNGGNGGNGVQITALATPTGTGVNGFYAGGGGGMSQLGGTVGSGGSGGGGAGGLNVYGISGTANTGGGAGGTGQPSGTANNGGSGLVIVRYAV